MGFALSNMQLTSSAFEPGAAIPDAHTGAGEDVSPPLSWTQAPEDTESFAVVCHDPDAPLVKSARYGFVHWVLYNLPKSTNSLEAGTSQGITGENDFGRTGYGGPMPPPGHGVHHYFFWVLALDQELGLEAGLSLEQFLHKAESHVLGMNRLMGTFERH